MKKVGFVLAMMLVGAIAGLITYGGVVGTLGGALAAAMILLLWPSGLEHIEDSSNQGYEEGDTVPLNTKGADEGGGAGENEIFKRT